jgi:hypothetical protein
MSDKSFADAASQQQSYRPCDPAPSDQDEVRKFLTILSEQALRVCPPGSLMQISSVHPCDDKLVPVGRFMMGDIDHMVEAAIGAADAGFNVYVEGRTIRPDTPPKLRGDASHTAGVFSLGSDSDADKKKTAKAELTPSLMVETSPKNYHPWYFPSEPMSVEAAQEIGEGMRAAGGDAGATGKLTQPYRIAGTPNYPNLIKQRRGRFEVHPTSILEHSGVTYSADQLRAAFPAPKKEQRASGTGGAGGEGVDWRLAFEKLPEPLQTLIRDGAHPGEDRSARFHSAVCQLKSRGWSADNVYELLDSYPNGIAQKYAGRLRKEVGRSFDKGDAPPDPSAVFGDDDDVGATPAPRPVIRIERGNLHGQATEGERALIAAGVPFYAHADELQKPIVDEVEATKGRKTKVARLASVGPDMLRDYLSRSVRWERYDERKKCLVPADPPRDVAAIILSREGEWQFPPTVGVITTPTLRPDGTILSQPGYDPATRLILMHPPALPVIPENPTRDDAAAALRLLDGLLDEFPFVDAASRSVALSELITPVVRGAMSVAPLHCNRAPTPGSGKSFLLDIASAISTGQPCPVISAGTDEFETEKRLGAALLKGQALIAIDNLNGELRGDALCQMIERPIVDVRILGLSRSVRIESRATLFATGNNIVPVGDVVRRVITSSLDSDLERPELRQFKGNPLDMVLPIGAAMSPLP